jgi:signal transduction histidine kinase
MAVLDSATLDACDPEHEATPGRFVRLDVVDDGVGMDAEVRSRMFEPFYSTRRPGRGLGISATLGIVRSHRGAICVTTAPGAGTTVSLLFPVDATNGLRTPSAGAELAS